MLIIAGKLYVAPEDRDKYIESHEDLLQRARKQPGCLDLAISADPVEAGRVNMFELWESEEHLAAWREVANAPAPVTEFLGGDIQKYQISSVGPVFD
ncbi:antibiotic biosynthesis monooxygenase [Thermobifida halotolerans]|uniref:Antibiotic biosynthesis monooxygenase n=1 Tax=Thermobifida halotolerans TaxID=483545 RepID=A0AA97M565_9ACTN|nr:antibiotic biosynthesis monooxygenase family protein [Thermobifida halotolerans]UOE21134.1 antibiotic biosynthesis monooxygenase [Thermobifida halotolerans]